MRTHMNAPYYDSLTKLAFDHSYEINKLLDKREEMDKGIFQMDLEELMRNFALAFAAPILRDLEDSFYERENLEQRLEEETDGRWT